MKCTRFGVQKILSTLANNIMREYKGDDVPNWREFVKELGD